LANLVGVQPHTIDAPPTAGPHTRIVAGSLQAFIALEGIVDIDAERERLSKTIADLEGVIEQSSRKLGNPQFVDKAPAEIVAKERDKVDAATSRLDKLRQQLTELE
jgi:valyl-tRNA synthetase